VTVSKFQKTTSLSIPKCLQNAPKPPEPSGKPYPSRGPSVSICVYLWLPSRAYPWLLSRLTRRIWLRSSQNSFAKPQVRPVFAKLASPSKNTRLKVAQHPGARQAFPGSSGEFGFARHKIRPQAPRFALSSPNWLRSSKKKLSQSAQLFQCEAGGSTDPIPTYERLSYNEISSPL